MTYLSVQNFWKYQNADVWKKANGHPPWFKCFVHRDRDIDKLPPLARLLWFEMLAAATRYSNVLEADLNWLYAETRVPVEAIAEMLPLLIKGGWLSETQTPRRSRKPSRETRDNLRDLPDQRRPEKDLNPPDQKPLLSTRATGLGDSSNEETLEQLGVRLAARPSVIGSEGRLFEVLPDMDEGSPAVIRAYLSVLPARTIEEVRAEVLRTHPRSPVKYAVGMLQKRANGRQVA